MAAVEFTVPNTPAPTAAYQAGFTELDLTLVERLREIAPPELRTLAEVYIELSHAKLFLSDASMSIAAALRQASETISQDPAFIRLRSLDGPLALEPGAQ